MQRRDQAPTTKSTLAYSSGACVLLDTATAVAIVAQIARTSVNYSRSRRNSIARFAEPVSAAAAAAAVATAAKAAGVAKAAAAAKAASTAASAKLAAGQTGAAVAAGGGAGRVVKGEEAIGGLSSPSADFNVENQIGAMPPLGFFDPVGFCKDNNQSEFRKLRAAEIKHGRVAMMSCIGSVVQHYIRIPGFENAPSGMSAVSAVEGRAGAIELFIACGALELALWSESPSREPGNFGDPLNLGDYSDEMRARELNNGRIAMFAGLGIISAELLTGQDGIEQIGL